MKNLFKTFQSEYMSFVREKIDKRLKVLAKRYENRRDPWGLDLRSIKKNLLWAYPIFDKYFNVKCHGQENVPKDGPFIVVANHSGQIPIDGMLIITAFLMELPIPTVLRGMAERFLFKVPFIGKLASQTGTILGDRKNCRYLLNHGESILVFPEGVKGIAKSTPDFYKLQNFTHGFYRLALEKNVPILPITVVGAEEFYPLVYHNKKLAKSLGVPALPLTPFFPLAGLLGMLPLPAPVDIYIEKPIMPKEGLDPDSSNYEIAPHVEAIKDVIQNRLDQALPNKRTLLAEWTDAS